jgi:uncharacterized protein involved in exopolysaccharide biosynthesis
MNKNKTDVPSLADFIRILHRHRYKSLMFFAMCVAVAVAAVKWLPRVYESEAKLFVRVGRESVGLDPTATTGQRIDVFESRENEINSVLEILRSRALLEKVVDDVGVAKILDQPKPTDDEGVLAQANLSPLGVVSSHILSQDEISDREQAIRELGDSVHMFAGEKSSVITVRSESRSPELAQDIAQAFVDRFMEEHLRVTRTEGSQEFFAEQAAYLEQQWDEAASELSRAKNELGVISISAQRDLIQKQLGDLTDQQTKTESELAAANARVGELKKTLELIPQRLTAQETTGFPTAADTMRERMYELQIKEREYLSKCTEAHPVVQALREQVREAQAILDKQPPERRQATTAINPAWQELQLEYLKEKANASSLSSKREKLLQQYAGVRQSLRELNTAEAKITQLEGRAMLMEGKYDAYMESIEQARIDRALARESISNINIVQPATFVEKPISPKRAITLLMGLAVGLFGALAITYLADQFDHSLRSADEVERRLDLPVLLAVPKSADAKVPQG